MTQGIWHNNLYKLRRTINFVRPIGKNVHGIILKVVKKFILKGLIMKELLSIEKNLNILFPQSYKNTINKFQLFMEIEFNNSQIDLFNEESLFDNLNGCLLYTSRCV